MMKFSKPVLFSCLFISGSLFAAPTDHHDPLINLDDYASISQPMPDDFCKKTPYCEPYGSIAKPNIYGELDQFDQYKESEKLQLLNQYTRDLIHSMYLLHNKVEDMAIDIGDTFEGIEYNLNNMSSRLANHESRITENRENLNELALYTTDEMAAPPLTVQPPHIQPASLTASSLSTRLQLDNPNLIKQMNNKLNALHVEVAKLDKKFNAGLATQAALSGLFQPDEKNIINFTAALGGHHRHMALAMGMGYHFNRHIATRAGVAFSPNSRITYNTAINFAW
ncbi:YadA-like family protein [Pasteurella sp. PK-2025]|uniref:YadA-like family protein n=1 Tax=Pasteurella sp. PK-2025 TaxID=3413133 RepID=UPI003C78FD07